MRPVSTLRFKNSGETIKNREYLLAFKVKSEKSLNKLSQEPWRSPLTKSQEEKNI
jgi:hypothetical protein